MWLFFVIISVVVLLAPITAVVWFQVQQRGVQGTKEILLKIIEALDIAADARLYVIDLVPNKHLARSFSFKYHPCDYCRLRPKG